MKPTGCKPWWTGCWPRIAGPCGGGCQHPRGVRACALAHPGPSFPGVCGWCADYDISIPDFRGDREQLIQTVLNIAHNACQALSERIGAGDAQTDFSHTVARQITFGKQRLQTGTGIACHRQRPGVPDSIKDEFSTRWCRVGRGFRPGADAGQTFVHAAPWPDRVWTASRDERISRY